jgi:hypothetical protein
MVDIKKVRIVLQNYILFFDPTKLTGTDGFLNYKMSGFGSVKRNKNIKNSGGDFAIIIIIIMIIILLKECIE